MSTYARCSREGCNRDELSDGLCYGHAHQKLADDFSRDIVLMPLASLAAIVVCVLLAKLVGLL